MPWVPVKCGSCKTSCGARIGLPRCRSGVCQHTALESTVYLGGCTGTSASSLSGRQVRKPRPGRQLIKLCILLSRRLTVQDTLTPSSLFIWDCHRREDRLRDDFIVPDCPHLRMTGLSHRLRDLDSYQLMTPDRSHSHLLLHQNHVRDRRATDADDIQRGRGVCNSAKSGPCVA